MLIMEDRELAVYDLGEFEEYAETPDYPFKPIAYTVKSLNLSGINIVLSNIGKLTDCFDREKDVKVYDDLLKKRYITKQIRDYNVSMLRYPDIVKMVRLLVFVVNNNLTD